VKSTNAVWGRNAVLVLLVGFGSLPMMSAADKSSPGEDTFKSHCVVCHGADGAGKTTLGQQLKAADLHGKEVQSQTDAQLKKIISDGNNNMPAFSEQVTAAEIDGLVKYVRTFGKAKK
jgi:mono/diheme cytochrome c family protein